MNVLFVAMSKGYLTRNLNVTLPFRNRIHQIIHIYKLFGLESNRHLNLCYMYSVERTGIELQLYKILNFKHYIIHLGLVNVNIYIVF